ncbi:serine/threonine-protein phosphatase 2A 65 kDa regulatory subunit A beta isoform-like [Adelges cooleyi]|uniref:serine/threonine-protein phosphatase 2A 65 kDa regulatory subunit A beta isoform-like n=1 Tax=Adelges cooleyi TaxID=133065 RepID=UPI0021808F90|nr:serine/threonine-protein phosphatase 2A 65 kDa regulatory subunit A beta isoform-like [Adelges cooleyi]
MCDVEESWESAHADFSILDDDLIFIYSFFESSKTYDFQEDRLDVNSNLKLVADKLGVKNTRTRLIPFLTNYIIAGKLTELKELALILGDFECYVGGPKYAHVLLSPLEELAGCKSSDVRMAAVRSLLAVAGIMEVSDLEAYFIPMIANMAVNDQCAKKWSVCHLFSAVYLRVDPEYQENLMQYYYYLSSDTLPSVRQDAAKCLADLSEVAQLPVIVTNIIPRLAQFSADQNEHVRTLALSSAIMISKRLDAIFTEQKIIPIILNSIEDRSWGVRLTVVKNITKDMVTLPEDRLICCLKAFIINDSWEIRNAGAMHLGTLAVQMGITFFEEYLKQAFYILLVDSKSAVQCTAMEVLKTLVNEFGMEWAQSSVVPYLINLSYTRNTYNKMAFLSFAKVCATVICIRFRSLIMNTRENLIQIFQTAIAREWYCSAFFPEK